VKLAFDLWKACLKKVVGSFSKAVDGFPLLFYRAAASRARKTNHCFSFQSRRATCAKICADRRSFSRRLRGAFPPILCLYADVLYFSSIALVCNLLCMVDSTSALDPLRLFLVSAFNDDVND
jgi:hypothetical protein